MSKLIDLKAEYEIARENVDLYFHVKNSTIAVMDEYPQANVEFVVNQLCEDNDFKREDFDFVCSIERQQFEDVMKSKTRKPRK